MHEETLFHLALEKSPDKRGAFLDDACAGDLALRERVEVLLRAHEASGIFLDRPPFKGVAAAGDALDQPGLPPQFRESAGEAATQAPGAPATAGPALGSQVQYFGDYELLEEIARGGMGVVYKARQVSLNRIVAVKMILAGQLATQADHDRFHAEAQAAAQLDHPNIVPVFEVGEHHGQHYFSMGYVDGKSLLARLSEGPMPPKEAAEIVCTVAEAVEYAHQQGVIHRDIKPSNILIDSQGRPRVTDFGLAKRVESGSDLTATGQVLGTPSYMPPEQAAGQIKAIGPSADIYALGALLYATLTGRPPFQAATALETMHQVLDREPVPPRQLNPAVPKDLETIAVKCLEKSIPRRYATAQAMADDLRRYLDGRPIVARPVGRGEHAWRWCRRNPVVAGLIAAVALTLITGVLISSGFAIKAERERGRANANAQLADRKAEEANTNAARADQKADEAARNAAWADEKAREALAEKKIAEIEKRKLQRQLVLPYIERGINELEHGEPARGLAMLGQAHAAASETNEAALRRSVCALVGAWQSKCARLLVHDAPVWAVAFSPDGTKLATASWDMTVRFWDATTGQPLGAPMKHEGAVSLVAFSPDGTKVATTSGGAVQLWDIATGQPLSSPIKHEKAVLCVAFSPDGTKLATVAASDFKARLWNLMPCLPLGHPMKHGGEVRAVAFSLDGTKFVTAGSEPLVRQWDTTTCGPLGVSIRHNTGGARSMVFSAGGTKLAAADSARSARLWDTATGQVLGRPMAFSNLVSSMVFSPDGTKLATVSITARLWDVASGQPLGLPMKHGSAVAALIFSPDGTKIATGSLDKTARLWDANTGQPLGEPIKLGGFVTASAFSPDGTKFVTVSLDEPRWSGVARLWPVPLSLPDDPRWVAAYVDAISAWKAGGDGALQPTSVAEAEAAWREVLKSPAWLADNRQDAARVARAWHENEADASEAENQWFAAAFHLRWLCRMEPGDAQSQQRLAHAEEHLAIKSTRGPAQARERQ